MEQLRSGQKLGVEGLVDPHSFHELMLFAEHRATLFGMDGRHFPAEAEIESWIQSLDARLIERFVADGPTGRDNLYLLFRRTGTQC